MTSNELPPLHELNEMALEFGLDACASVVHATASEKGFWPDKYYVDGLVTEEAICTKLALIHSEVTEVLEAIRKDQGKYKIVEEMADIYVRLIDLYAAMRNTGQIEDSMDDVVLSKMKKNSARPMLHGNKF